MEKAIQNNTLDTGFMGFCIARISKSMKWNENQWIIDRIQSQNIEYSIIISAFYYYCKTSTITSINPILLFTTCLILSQKMHSDVDQLSLFDWSICTGFTGPVLVQTERLILSHLQGIPVISYID